MNMTGTIAGPGFAYHTSDGTFGGVNEGDYEPIKGGDAVNVIEGPLKVPDVGDCYLVQFPNAQEDPPFMGASMTFAVLVANVTLDPGDASGGVRPLSAEELKKADELAKSDALLTPQEQALVALAQGQEAEAIQSQEEAKGGPTATADVGVAGATVKQTEQATSSSSTPYYIALGIAALVIVRVMAKR